jgi:diguanylate cyclase (GGDEF)-like protein/PAS domain S-box-containing protein
MKIEEAQSNEFQGQEMRIAAAFFESREGKLVTDANQIILKVNEAFTTITGYSAEETIGKTPQMLASGCQNDVFFSNLWRDLERLGLWQGEILNRKKNGEIYPQLLCIKEIKNEKNIVTHYTSTFSDISARKDAELKIEHLQFFDHLTDLPNLRYLMMRLKQALDHCDKNQRKGAVLYIGLDRFKLFNKMFGHLQGDKIIKEVGIRLRSCVGEGDTVGRSGGDEFVVLLEQLSENGVTAAAQAEECAQKILRAISTDYLVDGLIYKSNCSIGIGLIGVEPKESPSSVLKLADLALLQAKMEGGNKLCFYEPEMNVIVAARVALEASFREAVAKGQFVLYYQPQIIGEEKIVGVEALLRWQHPSRGLVFPTEFIDIAEETGLIVPLGQWVIETACRQLKSWSSRPEMSDITIAVNVSALQFHQTGFVSSILAAIEKTGANPCQLKLELTESLLINDLDSVVTKMQSLKSIGIKLSLDDFGTGYSSLLHLKRLPLDELKIDKEFINDILSQPNDASIAKMMISLASSMGLEVIAEGVETEPQRDYLAHYGCNSYQGYLFSKPLPLEKLEELLLNRP